MGRLPESDWHRIFTGRPRMALPSTEILGTDTGTETTAEEEDEAPGGRQTTWKEEQQEGGGRGQRPPCSVLTFGTHRQRWAELDEAFGLSCTRVVEVMRQSPADEDAVVPGLQEVRRKQRVDQLLPAEPLRGEALAPASERHGLLLEDLPGSHAERGR